MGFLDVEYEGVLLSRRGTSCIPPSFDCPLLSLEGHVFSTSHEQIKYSAISAQRFVAAGMALVYANLVVENAREDALGALKAGQWGGVREIGPTHPAISFDCDPECKWCQSTSIG